MTRLLWLDVGPEFGTAHKNGCCNAAVVTDTGRLTVCGWPRRPDGTCYDSHPAQPLDADLVARDEARRLLLADTA